MPPYGPETGAGVGFAPLGVGVRCVVVTVVVVGCVAFPFETLIRTVLPRASFCPAAGLSATTVPFGCDDGTCTACAVNPSRRSVAIADACGCPTTFGMVTLDLPFATSST